MFFAVIIAGKETIFSHSRLHCTADKISLSGKYEAAISVILPLMKKMIFLPMLFLCACFARQANENASIPTTMTKDLEIATFAGGCFWCTEAVFLELEGVSKVVSGYIGGQTKNPTYRDICTGTTGHAEAIQIWFDPKKISFGELLEIFFATHDPTTLNRQGNDIGTQYRSEIFYHSDLQRDLAKGYIELLNTENTFGKKVVTALSSATASQFYPAEDYHQNYYALNQREPYCQYVVTPKVAKVRSAYAKKLKK
jgi:peptide-methionine (S)-S-oxide reductase